MCAARNSYLTYNPGKIIVFNAIRYLYLIIKHPSVIFLFTLTIILLSPPGVGVYFVDRIAFGLVTLVAIASCLFNHERFPFKQSIIIPMLAIICWAIWDALSVQFNIQTWSLIADKFIMPFTMYFVAQMVFKDDASLKYFFLFSIVLTVYLTLISIATLIDARFLIFPRFILDPTLGPPEHILRARGPFLNAVPNGMAIIMLGLLSFHWFNKNNVKNILPLIFIITIPFAIIATMTRGIWLSFAFVVIILIIRNKGLNKFFINISLLLFLLSIALGVIVLIGADKFILERLQNQENVDFRLKLYSAGFEMFMDKPLLGWGINQVPFIMSKYLIDYKDAVWVHNTYFEILLEQGVIGFLFYALIFIKLFSTGKWISLFGNRGNLTIIDEDFVFLWRLIIGVYLICGMTAIINYKFINVLFFTLAGIIVKVESSLIRNTGINQINN